MHLLQWTLAILAALIGATTYLFGCLPLAALLTKRGYEGIGLFAYVVFPLPVIGLVVYAAYKLPAWLWALLMWIRNLVG